MTPDEIKVDESAEATAIETQLLEDDVVNAEAIEEVVAEELVTGEVDPVVEYNPAETADAYEAESGPVSVIELPISFEDYQEIAKFIAKKRIDGYTDEQSFYEYFS